MGIFHSCSEFEFIAAKKKRKSKTFPQTKVCHPRGNKDLPFATHTPSIPGHTGMNTLTSNYWILFQLVKKYGNVISLDFGIMSSVIISSMPLIKEAFTHLDDNFMSRPKFPIQKYVFNENGKSFMYCNMYTVIFMIHKRHLYALFIQHSHKPIPSWNVIINGSWISHFLNESTHKTVCSVF